MRVYNWQDVSLVLLLHGAHQLSKRRLRPHLQLEFRYLQTSLREWCSKKTRLSKKKFGLLRKIILMGKDELFRNIGRMVPTISDHRYVISPTSSHLQVNEKYMKEILWHNGQKKKKREHHIVKKFCCGSLFQRTSYKK